MAKAALLESVCEIYYYTTHIFIGSHQGDDYTWTFDNTSLTLLCFPETEWCDQFANLLENTGEIAFQTSFPETAITKESVDKFIPNTAVLTKLKKIGILTQYKVQSISRFSI